MAAHSVIVTHPNTQSVYFGDDPINLSAISRISGIDCSYLSRIFRGQRTPRAIYIRKISQAMDMTMEQFMDALERHLNPTNPAN